uniref:Cathepsin propeptide inhibitor domain-containing protein n=1 Tax=Cuerna arida TaxID=1464854 RepID=A0A1B6EVI4_9HEMI
MYTRMMSHLVISLIIMYLVLTLQSEAKLHNYDPAIPDTVDQLFVDFQKDVYAKQAKHSLEYLYNNYNSFKKDFEQYKTKKIITKRLGVVDLSFKQFQQFMKRFSRIYKNIEEFRIRYDLFLQTWDLFKDQMVAGQKLAMSNLSDRTLSEQTAEHDRLLNESHRPVINKDPKPKPPDKNPKEAPSDQNKEQVPSAKVQQDD